MPSISASKPARQVKLDKTRPIRFNWSAACRFEEAYGKSIPEAMQANIGVRLMTHLAWSGMLHGEPSLTLRETERRIQAFINQDGNVNDLAQELLLALVDSGVLGKSATPDTPDEETPEGNEPAVSQE